MWSERRGLLPIALAAGLLVLSSAAAHAGDQKSLHVVFTGGVEGRLEPSG
jgi:hypothetical protein